MGTLGVPYFYTNHYSLPKGVTRKDVNFIGYTFNREVESQRSYLLQALLDLENIRPSGQRMSVPYTFLLQTETKSIEKKDT